MRPQLRVVLCAASLPLLACTSAPTATPIQAIGTTEGVQVSVGDCLVAPKRAQPSGGDNKSVGPAIIGAVISQGVNYLGKALTAAGAAKTWTLSASRNIQITSAQFPQCVAVVRGSFLTTGVGAAWQAPPWLAERPAKAAG